MKIFGLWILRAMSYIPLLRFFSKFLFKLNRVFNRFNFARSYYRKNLKLILRWSFRDTEDSNFYYRLTKRNDLHLVSMISHITGVNVDKVQSYLTELEEDTDLKTDIQRNLISVGYGQDIVVEFGRRVGWYVLARILKPKVIVETGVSHGVGALVLTSALLRNRSEGFEGLYFGTDIDLSAGKLLQGKYKEVGKMLFGDSLETLRHFPHEIDFFVNDSDHSEKYESSEYEVVSLKLSKNSIILGDNAHSTDALFEFSLKNGRDFIFFKEIPDNHWYPGAGIGISFNRLVK